MTAPEPTPEQAEAIALARAQAVERLAPHVRGIGDVIDVMHGVGFSIPQPVTDALQVLGAFAMALAANARGQAAPRDAALLLGLADPEHADACGDCGGFRRHAPWCPE